jgi:DNA-binding Lrp family transcriptional regulator
MIKAIVLVRIKPQVRIADKIKKVEGVKDAFHVSGRFDAIVVVEAKELSDIKKIVLEIQKIEGVKRTETLIHVG